MLWFFQTWVLKVSLHCEGCKRKVKKVLQSIDGTKPNQKYEKLKTLFVILMLRIISTCKHSNPTYSLSSVYLKFLRNQTVFQTFIVLSFFVCCMQVFLTQALIHSNRKLQSQEMLPLRPWSRSWLKQGNTQRYGRKSSPGKIKSPGKQRTRTKKMTQKVGLVAVTKTMRAHVRKLRKSSAQLKMVEVKVARSRRRSAPPMKGRRRRTKRAVRVRLVVVQLLLQKVLVVKRRKGKVKKVIMRVVVWVYNSSVRLHAMDLKVMVWAQRIWALHVSHLLSTHHKGITLRWCMLQVTTGYILAKVLVPPIVFHHHHTRMQVPTQRFIQFKQHRWIPLRFSVMKMPMGAPSCDQPNLCGTHFGRERVY